MKHWLLFFFCITLVSNAQENIPNDYFDNPMKIPLVLSGSFGELRSNHFHSGLDIKTQQRTGIPIYAPADGYVERIKVSHFGYGKALYIKHPNGYSTVYAHLSKYAGSIQEYVKKKQYDRESYEIELFPESSQLPVKKGELIAYSGNSGSSGGPHLHYEIRDASSRPMNPMLFGVEIPDSKKPLVGSLFVYPIGEGSQVNQSENPQKIQLIKQQDGNYTTQPLQALGKIGFGISTTDQQDGAYNKNGTYRIKTTYNGSTNFEVLFNRFSFAETRYLNRYIDYEYFETNRSRIQKLFRQENNPLSLITEEVNSGYLSVEDGYSGMYTIEVSDFQGNSLSITVPIEGKDLEVLSPKKVEETEDFVIANQAYSITKGNFSIYIPSGSLYEDTYLSIKTEGDTLHFHKDIVPIHKNITISIEAPQYKPEDFQKLYLGRINYKGTPYYSATYKEGTKISTKTRTFGSYCLAMDNKAPRIRPLNFKEGQWISKNNTLRVKIQDNESGIASYRATLNGKFILMEYEYKKDLLEYDFDDGIVSDTENKFELIVTDNVGNSTTFEATFFRKSP